MRRGSWLLAVVGAAVLLSMLVVIAADASSSIVASFGVRGAAKVTSGGPNTVYVNLKSLTNGAWTETLYAGTCAKVGTRIKTLPSLTVVNGAVRRTDTLSSSQARTASKGIIRIAHASATYCASFAAGTIPTRTASPSPTRTASPTPTTAPSSTPTATAPGTASPTATATSTITPTGTSGSCTADNTYVCVGDTLAVGYDDGANGTLAVDQVQRSAPDSSGMVTEDVLMHVTGPAGEDVTYPWEIGDTAGTPATFTAQGGAPSPAYPSHTNSAGVAEGWLRFRIPASIHPFITTPGGAGVRLA